MDKYIIIKKKKIKQCQLTKNYDHSLNDEDDENFVENNDKTKKRVSYIFTQIDNLYYKYKSKGYIKITSKEIRDYYQTLYNKNSLLLISKFTREIPPLEKYYKRLVKEFILIEEKNFTKVFLQVYDILSLLSNNIPHIIRGSSGSCLVCYLMGITNVDPIKEKISLARFMHEQRDDIPDIDMDFPSKIRNDIFEKIFLKWPGRVARISNNVRFKLKSAIKQAVRNRGYNKFLSRDFKLEDLYSDQETIDEVTQDAYELLGKIRCKSLHCGGIVIFDEKVPEELLLKTFKIKENSDTIGKQLNLDKEEVEKKNFIKIDILSNRGLSQLMDISTHAINKYPINDRKIWDIFSNGDNFSLTHGESRSIRKVFIMLKPQNISEVACALALIRPAASGNGQKSAFLRDYKMLNKDKKNIHDYIIYDDDAIQYISRILGVHESDADIYRKGFAKKNYRIKQKFKYLLKKKNNKFTKEKCDIIYDNLEQLENYSFCKSHAYSYARLLIASAYHKHYNPKKFWLSTLNNCNSSYRKWVSYRNAKTSGLNLTIGKPPWKIRNNTLVSKSSINRFKYDNICDYFKYGYWLDDEFLPNMYFKTKEKISLKGMNKGQPFIEVSFRGIIATGRCFYTTKKRDITKNCGQYISGQEEYTKKNRMVTFVTLGYNNNKFIDLVMWGTFPLRKIHCLEGFGKLCDKDSYPWIAVNKFNITSIK